MKKIFIFLISFCAMHAAWAQSSFNTSYTIGFPTGELSDFISKTSFRGVILDYRYRFTPNMAFGVTSGWSTFYNEEDHATYTDGGASLTGKQFRYSNNVPILATFSYFLSPDEQMNPFATLGIGTMYTRRNTDMNVYTLEQESWNFLLQPGIGFQYGLSEGFVLEVSGRYNYGMAAGELDDPQSYLSLNIGFCVNYD